MITAVSITESHVVHLRRAVAAATLATDPGPHMVIADLLPADIYALLFDTMPPEEGFDIADSVKANFDPDRTTIAPERSRQTWMWFQRDVIDGVLTPLLVARFQPHLATAYRDLFGPDLAEDAVRLPKHAFRGRLMLRRPGYRLKPHRDMRIAALTGLIYFARPGDSADYGTDLYRIDHDRQATTMKTFYPESCGGRAEHARSVPFVGNAALVFMNAPGMAHGASIPRDATQATRYAYQFYIGPPKDDFGRLIRRLPVSQQAEVGAAAAPELDEGY
jgi:hypothetical protein